MGVGRRVFQKAPVVIPRLDDPEAASIDERDEHLMLLEAARQVLEVEWTATLAAADEAGDHDVMGYPSTVAYLKHRMRMAGGRAHRYVKNARASLRHAATFSAWKHRQISGDEAELMFRASERTPDIYPEAEHVLLELVGDGPDETRRVLDLWRSDVDLPGVVLDIEQQLERRHFDMIRRHNGMLEGNFALPRLEGESLLTAIDALMPPPGVGETRTTTQRRADALGDLGRCFLDGSETPTVGGERPHLSVHVDLEALVAQVPGAGEAGDGSVLDPFAISQIVCDASVSRIIFAPGSEVLDVGRKTRVIPAGLRRAVVARDRYCVSPGCGRSARWCDVHHIVAWADGGETAVDNLCLLCRYHHSLVHLDLLDLSDVVARPEVAAARST